MAYAGKEIRSLDGLPPNPATAPWNTPLGGQAACLVNLPSTGLPGDGNGQGIRADKG